MDLGDGYPKACACGSVVFSPEMARKHRCSGASWAGGWGHHAPLRDLSPSEASAVFEARSSIAAWCEACGRPNDQPRPFRLGSGETAAICGECRRRCRGAGPRGPRSLFELRVLVRGEGRPQGASP